VEFSLVTDKPVVIYDTSAINALYDDVYCDARLTTLRCAYHPRLVFSVLDELVATQDAYKNKRLYDMALSLQSAGDPMLPFNYLLIAHMREYCTNATYDWKAANCSGEHLREAIIENRHGMTEQLTKEQLASNRITENEYKNALKSFRKLLQEVDESLDVFATPEDFLKQAFEQDGRFWKLGASLMNHALEIIREEEPQIVLVPAMLGLSKKPFVPDDAIRFAELCPPFNSLILGIAQSEYSRVHDPSLNEEQRKKSAGRADTYMSVYLPYCRFFVTNDAGQFSSLAPTASRAGLKADVIMYSDFWKKLPY
jgi:hypothetical protein